MLIEEQVNSEYNVTNGATNGNMIRLNTTASNRRNLGIAMEREHGPIAAIKEEGCHESKKESSHSRRDKL